MFKKVAIVGLGLIGSSIAFAIRRERLAAEISGYDVLGDVRSRAAKLSCAINIHSNAQSCVYGADLVLICAPVGVYKSIIEIIGPHLMVDSILSDVGSVKGEIVRDVAPFVPGHVHFVPAHPIAGSEYSGPEAAVAKLFDGRLTIITPPKGTSAAAVARLKAFWESLGALVEVMDAFHHDFVLAITSHLPHLIAFSIMGTTRSLERAYKTNLMKYSANGFRDFTRIAGSDPTVWRDIFLSNRDAVLEVLARFEDDLALLQCAIKNGDSQLLFDSFARARDLRKELSETERV